MKNEALNIAYMLKTLRTNPNDGEVSFSINAIEEVEMMIRKLVAELDKHQDKSLDELMKWQQELDKQGEPVGWLNNTTTFSEVNTGLGGKALIDTTPQTNQCKDCGEINPAEIHTCSPQTKPLSEKITEALNRKPLSDEEIHMLIGLHIPVFNEPKYDDLIKFARAIEERHGIK